ncbi:MAG: T9SS type A sorting domain-containing protein [Candidatus Latescibacteria bacterium]|nr:T9SS type A sorting domain-containing protein [Candidatus Latescibacterota bacterium]
MSLTSLSAVAALYLGIALMPCAALAAEGRFVSETLHSKALEGNLLEDSPDRSVVIYLPPSYDSSPEKHYPVVYLLHGYLMDSESWTTGLFGRDKEFSNSTFKILQGLNHFMTEHPDQELILVMPDAFNRYLGSWYTNSPVTGNWEDFLTQELVQHIDSTYRTLPQATHRGLAGYSMGGEGAWKLAMLYPDVYGAIYALSGGGPLGEAIGDPGAWRKVLAIKEMSQLLNLNVLILANFAIAAAVSPNPDNPPFFVDFPVELVGEELKVVDAIWQRWIKGRDVVAMAHTYRESLRQLRGIRFGFGTGEIGVLNEGWPVSQALDELGILHVYEEYEGGHLDHLSERIETKALPFLAQALYGYLPTLRQVTTRLGNALAGQPLTPNLQIELAGPLEATGAFPQMNLDLSPLGLEETSLLHDGQGRYTFTNPIAPPHNGRFRLPVRLHPDGMAPYLFFDVALDVWPTEEQVLFADGLAPEWQTTTSNSVTLDPQATTQVFAGNTSLGVQASGNSFALRFLPSEPLDSFGYTLRFAFHPGEATGGSLPSFRLVLKGVSPDLSRTLKLIGGGLAGVEIDLEKKEWQVIEVPLQEMFLGEPAQSIELLGSLKGTFYLDDVRLMPQAAPVATAVAEERTAALPQSFTLFQNYPNPFNSSSVIRFSLPASGEVELAVFDLAGQKVAVLAGGMREAGAYTVRWDGRDEQGHELASGVYLYRLQSGAQVETRKLVLAR